MFPKVPSRVADRLGLDKGEAVFLLQVARWKLESMGTSEAF